MLVDVFNGHLELHFLGVEHSTLCCWMSKYASTAIAP